MVSLEPKTLKNLGIDTNIVYVSLIVSELGPNDGIPIMAALICIFHKTLKGARAASSGFMISTQRYKDCKKLCREDKTRFTQKTGIYCYITRYHSHYREISVLSKLVWTGLHERQLFRCAIIDL